MKDRVFEAPVFVNDGKHQIQGIYSLDDALDFLENWPPNRRGPIYQTALRACHRAYSRDVSLDVARNALVGFARSAGVHEGGDSLLPIAMNARTTGRGGVPA